jgi:Putative peptidoglycan binding domain
MAQSYANANLGRGAPNADLVRDLQRDLRALGYLKQGIDGVFQDGTDAAVRRLQFDLANNDGSSTGGDGRAPVAIRDYAGGQAIAVTGVVDPNLATCIEALLTDPNVPKLPNAADAAAANRAARAAIAAAPSTVVPTPFLLAIFQQESDGQHYREPTGSDPTKGDSDNYVVVGLDFRQETADHVTSRGYGMGQYTIFHHPPRPQEVQEFILDPVRNVQKAVNELRDKFDNFVLGGTSETTADDRVAEHPVLSTTPPTLRVCRYQAGDARYLTDCRACAMEAGKLDLTPTTPVYVGATDTYGQAPHYTPTTYRGVPDRADFKCDWPYAVRRYNGSGPDSYNYQAKVLQNLLATPPLTQVS